MRRRRVVITGLGVVAPNGIGIERFRAALLSGQSGIQRVPANAPDVGCHVMAPVPDFNLAAIFSPRDRKSVRSTSRLSQFALACSHMALEDAGFDPRRANPGRTGLCYGTTTGKPDFDNDAERFREGGPAALHPTAWAEFSPHAPASHIAQEFGFSGPIATYSSGCCTGLSVIDWGASRIAEGRLDTVLVGSGDSLLSPLVVAAFGAGHLLTKQLDPTQASRPYDRQRDGLVPGEAAGAVVLEDLESAIERKARIYAEYLGSASAVDVRRPGERNGASQGLARAIAGALDHAGLRPQHVDCINAHGLSHQVFDREETQAFKAALGAAAYCVPITSIKSMTGASFAADGILQVVSSCLILERGLIPPILHLETPDPECDLDYVVARPRAARINHLLTNTRALGGTNSALLLGRVDAGRPS